MPSHTRHNKKSAQKARTTTPPQHTPQPQSDTTQEHFAPDYGHLQEGASLTPDMVRSLQATHGNHYVQRLIHRGDTSTLPAFIQRRVPEDARTDKMLNDPDKKIAEINLQGLKTAIKRMMNHIANVSLIKWLNVDMGIKKKLGKDTTAILKGNDPKELKALIKEMRKITSNQSLIEYPTADKGFVTPTGADRKKLEKGVNKCHALLMDIASGKHDQHLKDIFGTHPTFGWDKTKPRFKQAAIWLKKMFKKDKIGADRGGENREIGLGGMTSFHGRILLAPGAVDDPTTTDALILIAHEAMHTGNHDIDDIGGYHGMAGFEKKSQKLKFKTAAYYEEAVARALGKKPKVKVFVPDVVPKKGKKAKGSMTHYQRAASKAADQFREAWDNAVDVFFLFKEEFHKQEGNPKHKMPKSKRKSLLFNSVLMNLTFHQRHAVDKKSKINLMDLALAEGAAKLFSQATGFIKTVAPKDGNDLIVQIIHPEFADPKNEAKLVKYIIEGVLKEVGEITGSPARDFQAFKILNKGDSILSTQAKPPALPK